MTATLPIRIVEALRELTAPAARKCDTRNCDHPAALAVYDAHAIDQTYGARPGYIFKCNGCGWKQTEPIIDVHIPVAEPEGPQPEVNGWTASCTPCRRAGDVDAR